MDGEISCIIFILATLLLGAESVIDVRFSPGTIEMQPGQLSFMNIELSESVKHNTTIYFLYQEDAKIRLFQLKEIIVNLSNITVVPGKLHYEFLIAARDVGEVIVLLHSHSTEIRSVNQLHVDISVYKSLRVEVIAEICGWLYVFGWTFKYVPQIYLNWKTQSCVGLSLDFVAFNLYGVIAYALYNSLLFWVPYLKRGYKAIHPVGVYPVKGNDMFVSLAMLFVSIIQGIQCVLYDTGGQRLSRLGIIIQIMIFVFLLLMLILTLTDVFIWLTFLTSMSYIKVLSNLFKYIPQIVLNYQRKSTEGWSIYYVVMDTIGSAGSLVQMFLQAENQADWTSLYGNLPKLSLGIITLTCDIIFLVQHFIFYKGQQPYEFLSNNKDSSEKDRDEQKNKPEVAREASETDKMLK